MQIQSCLILCQENISSGQTPAQSQDFRTKSLTIVFIDDFERAFAYFLI